MLVIGGVIFTGVFSLKVTGFDRVQGDYMGMLATIINGMSFSVGPESIDVQTRLLTAYKNGQE